MTETARLTITHLGGKGDGIARHEGETVYVPYTLPGEEVRVCLADSSRAELIEVLTPSPDRQTPPCRHFGNCGGCSLQHLTATAYREFKMQSIRQMLERLGLSTAILAPMMETGERSRRRASFKISVCKGVIHLGFYTAYSHQLVDLQECPLLQDEIVALLPLLKECLKNLKKPGNYSAVHITELAEGLDILLTAKEPTKAIDRQKLADFLVQHTPVLRISEKTQQGLQRLAGAAEVFIALGDFSVVLPADAFLQASSIAQEAMTQRVKEHLQGCASVVDLYSGCGAYALPLAAQSHHVSAFEGSAEMIAATLNAILRAGMESRLSATCRDLYKHPLTSVELESFEGAVINPPHNGAMPQCQHLAASSVQKVVMVSCNPATFERDAQLLLKGGYQMVRLTPIDQFYWSSHLELVAEFRR